MSTEKKMSRRTALKRLGIAVVSGVVASSGVLSFASCGARARKRIILYFTATGNCLYVARQLGGENAELLSIPQLVKQKKYELEADEIGIVYPIYGHMPPNMVKQFIRKAKLKADYKFAVLTYGNRTCNAVEIWDNVSRQAGNAFDYISTIVMVDNWLPNFDMAEQMKIDKHIPENLARIKADLAQQRKWHEPVTEEQRQNHREFMERTGLDEEVGFLMRSENFFTVTAEACIGCGACADVCPRGNYELSSKGVAMTGDCDFCFACIQNCPQRAIRFKERRGQFPDGTEKNPNVRYRNEHISLMDIKRANNQNL